MAEGKDELWYSEGNVRTDLVWQKERMKSIMCHTREIKGDWNNARSDQEQEQEKGTCGGRVEGMHERKRSGRGMMVTSAPVNKGEYMRCKEPSLHRAPDIYSGGPGFNS